MWVEGGGGSLGIKLHLEVKCLQRQWLERLLRSDLDGRVSIKRAREGKRGLCG